MTTPQSFDGLRPRVWLGILTLGLGPVSAPFAQVADFQIVWVNVGEVAATTNEKPTRAGRQLFMAPDLVQFSLKKITVARIDVEPELIHLEVGERFCLTSLQVHAKGDDRNGIDNAPMSVSVRQDHRERLAVERGKADICFAPTTPGEYPVRLNSLLPAKDGTLRGAQIYLRVNPEEPPVPAINTASAI